jgi:hypothetical protein
MMDKLQVVAVFIGLAMAVLFPTALVWIVLALAVVLIIREKIQRRRQR